MLNQDFKDRARRAAELTRLAASVDKAEMAKQETLVTLDAIFPPKPHLSLMRKEVGKVEARTLLLRWYSLADDIKSGAMRGQAKVYGLLADIDPRAYTL